MNSKSIKQRISFNATPHDVYEALIDSKKHTMFSVAAAKISRKIGGSFSVYDGYAFGVNLELVPDAKIVQTWKASDWDAGQNSNVIFDITPSKTGCILRFQHINVPKEHFSSIKQGWADFYWVPLKKFLKTVKK